MQAKDADIFVARFNKINRYSDKLKNRDNKYWLFIFYSGEGKHSINHKIISITGRAIHFVAPGVVQSFTGLKNVSGYCIAFTEEFFSRHTINKDILFRLPFFSYDLEKEQYKIPASQFSFIYSLIAFMEKEFRQRKEGCEKIILSCINVILIKCSQLFQFKNKKTEKAHYTSFQLVESYKKLIRQHHAKQHFVNYYASRLNQTPNYLNIAVKEITGQTASALIHAQIIIEAKYLLIHTKLSPKEVAAELGFADQSYFTKFFRRKTGMNPLVWFNKHK